MKEMVYQKERIIDLLYKGKHKGYNFYIMNLGTHPTAYIEIPKDNVLYLKSYNKIYNMGCDIEVHGGLTYSSQQLLISDDTKLDNSWFIGWDYAHYGDFSGADLLYPKFPTNGKKWTTVEIYVECKNVINQIIEINRLWRNKIYINTPTSISIGKNTWCNLDTKLVGRVKALIEENDNLQQKIKKYENFVKEINDKYYETHKTSDDYYTFTPEEQEILNMIKEVEQECQN